MNMAQTSRTSYPPLAARFARLATAAHVSIYRLTGGAIGRSILNLPVLLLTTTGRKTGKPRTTPLAYFTDGADFFVVASNGGQGKLPNWWLNMRGNGLAQIEIGRKKLRVSVQEADPVERQRLWARAVAGFAGYARYQQQTPYPIPLVILHPMA